MTEFQHLLVAQLIFMPLWIFWLKRYFISGKEMKQWREFLKEYREKK